MTASDIDHIINHLSLKKSRNRWRWFAIVIAVLGLVALIAAFADRGPSGDHVARLRIDGLITGSQAGLDLLEAVAKDDTAKAVILRIDSPGGTTAGSEALYEAIRKTAAKKPVIAVMDTVAASGGYIAALATDRLYARGNTITGSIGVIFTFPEVSRLLSTVGVTIEEIKSGELKAEPSPYRPVSDKARAYAQVMVDDGFRWFKGLVAERRKLDPAKVDALADGRVFTGRQAKLEGLIDELGGEEEALSWLKAEKKVADGLEVREWQPPQPFAERVLGMSLSSLLGLDDVTALAARARLEGLLVLWQPSY